MVTLKSSAISLVVLPHRGGKLVSLMDRATGSELVAQPTHGTPSLYPGMAFESGDAAGFDDVFPSMGEDAYAPWPSLPDHGVIWTGRMQVKRQDRASVTLDMEGDGWSLEKTISLSGRTVSLSWAWTGNAPEPLPYVHVFHGLWQLDPDTCFLWPDGQEKATDVLRREEPSVPLLRSCPKAGSMAKQYLPQPLADVSCGAVWPSRRLEMEMKASGFPFLGLWVTAGGWRSDWNFAFEPATAFYDSIRRSRDSGTLTYLSPGETRRSTIAITILPST